jgi:hypothetical protein
MFNDNGKSNTHQQYCPTKLAILVVLISAGRMNHNMDKTNLK